MSDVLRLQRVNQRIQGSSEESFHSDDRELDLTLCARGDFAAAPHARRREDPE